MPLDVAEARIEPGKKCAALGMRHELAEEHLIARLVAQLTGQFGHERLRRRVFLERVLGVFGDVGDHSGAWRGDKQHDAHQGDIHHAEGIGLERRRLLVHLLKQRAVGVGLEVTLEQGQVRGAFQRGLVACDHFVVNRAGQWRVVEAKRLAERELILRADVELAANVFEALRREPGAADAVGDRHDIALAACVTRAEEGEIEKAVVGGEVTQRRVEQRDGLAGLGAGHVERPPGLAGVDVEAQVGVAYLHGAVVAQGVFQQGFGEGVHIVQAGEPLVQQVLPVPVLGNRGLERGWRGHDFEAGAFQCAEAFRRGLGEPVRQGVADVRVVGAVEGAVEWR